MSGVFCLLNMLNVKMYVLPVNYLVSDRKFLEVVLFMSDSALPPLLLDTYNHISLFLCRISQFSVHWQMRCDSFAREI